MYKFTNIILDTWINSIPFKTKLKLHLFTDYGNIILIISIIQKLKFKLDKSIYIYIYYKINSN